MSRANPESHQLLRVLGPIGATTVVVGSVIGSGIFFKAKVIAVELGRFDLVLLVWIVCGVISLLGALAAAELGAMMPHAGGQYVYLREAYGPLSGFLWGWGEFWMMRTGSTAALAVAFAKAFDQSLGSLLHDAGWIEQTRIGDQVYESLFGLGFMPQAWMHRLIAIIAIVMLTLVNVVGARWGGLTQNVTTIMKAATLVALMVLPFLTRTADWVNLTTRYETTQPAGLMGLIAAFAAAMTASFWAYDGWGNIGPVAEEVRDPQRNIPLSLFVGMFILIVLYIGTTVAYHLVLTMTETAQSGFVAASACQRMLGEHGAAIASAAVMVSTFGALNSNLLVGPRVIFAMARDRLFLSPMAAVHPRYRTPHIAIISESVWAVLLILGSDLLKNVTVPAWVSTLPAWLAVQLTESLKNMPTKDIFDVLTDFVIFGQFVFYLLATAAVFVLRMKRPEWPRPYRTYGYPVLPFLFVLSSAGFLILMFYTTPVESVIGVVFLGLGAIAYQFSSREARRAR
jgi:basic amino acid/polyamine antiporter, APA family